MPQTTWATVSDVTALTGITASSVEAFNLEAANAAVEMHAGRIYTLAIANTGTRDVEWMRRAVAFQCAWMTGQPDVFTRLDFTQVGKERGTPTGITETAMTLAPLARLALRRVSWLKSRSLHVRAPFQDGLGPLSSDPLSSGNDFYQAWAAI